MCVTGKLNFHFHLNERKMKVKANEYNYGKTCFQEKIDHLFSICESNFDRIL